MDVICTTAAVCLAHIIRYLNLNEHENFCYLKNIHGSDVFSNWCYLNMVIALMRSICMRGIF